MAKQHKTLLASCQVSSESVVWKKQASQKQTCKRVGQSEQPVCYLTPSPYACFHFRSEVDPVFEHSLLEQNGNHSISASCTAAQDCDEPLLPESHCQEAVPRSALFEELYSLVHVHTTVPVALGLGHSAVEDKASALVFSLWL